MLFAPDGSGYPHWDKAMHFLARSGRPEEARGGLRNADFDRGVKAYSGIRHPFINFIGMIEISFRRHNYYPYICTQFNYKLQP
jgi:hypothetical protein